MNGVIGFGWLPPFFKQFDVNALERIRVLQLSHNHLNSILIEYPIDSELQCILFTLFDTSAGESDLHQTGLPAITRFERSPGV